MELPIELQTAIQSELASQPAGRLASIAEELSNSYRTGQPFNGGKYLRSYDDVAAYTAFRLPATYAAIYSALSQAKENYPGLNPKNLLDVGAGPGTAMWAAAALWPDLERITLLEREEHMISLGRRLSAYSSLKSMKEAQWIKTDITGTWSVPLHDLVISSYVLNEIPEDKREDFINRLWESTGGILLVIEPGTPADFLRIKQAREQLMALGAKTIAPCPHDKPCPMDDNDWCHFSQRISRSRLHRLVKSGELSYEDEKFSFLCMSREGGSPVSGRVIRHPQIRKGHIQIKLCTPDGLQDKIITRKSKEQFRMARDLSWGSAIHGSNDGDMEP